MLSNTYFKTHESYAKISLMYVKVVCAEKVLFCSQQTRSAVPQNVGGNRPPPPPPAININNNAVLVRGGQPIRVQTPGTAIDLI